MKTYMLLNGLRWSRNSGSFNCDMSQSAVFGRPGGGVMLIGRYSLEIYILHVFFVMIFPAVGQYMLSIDNWMSVFTFQLLYSFCLSLIAIVCSMLAAKFVKTSTLLKRLLFGQ